MGDNVPIKFKVTEFQYINGMPIVNGQIIILADKPKMYYDVDDTRHEVGDQRWELYSPS